MRQFGSLISTHKTLKWITSIIIITMPCYESGKSMVTAAGYESGDDYDKSDNNEDKIYSLLKR